MQKISKINYNISKSALPSEEFDDFQKNINNDYSGLASSEIGTDYDFQRKIVWKNAIGHLVLHMGALYGIWLQFTDSSWYTGIWAFSVGYSSTLAVAACAHRLYCHKSYKATPMTKLVLIFFVTVGGQNSLYLWVRDHRLHHKYSDTDADPHNANRGFFFSHCGWLMSKKHPAVIEKGKTIDMSDLEADWMVMFQKKHNKLLYVIFAIFLPTLVPVYFWNETWWNALFIAFMLRNAIFLNIVFAINSVAHIWGSKPFDKSIKPVESEIIAFLSAGEAWHNYHHAFPWDYRTAELGSKYGYTTFVIDTLAYFGLAYDLKTASNQIIKERIERAGDGTHPIYGHFSKEEKKE